MLTRCRPLLGTFVDVTVPDHGAVAIGAAFDAVERVHRAMSFHEEASDLARLRNAPAGEAVAVSPETVEVLQMARDLHEQTGGLFDVTVGRELVRGGFLPTPRAGRPGSFPGNAADIEILDESTVRCRRPVLIDLGGIAKGYAVDRAIAVLQGEGLSAGMVNAGGDLRMFGAEPWDVALRDADGLVREQLSLRDCAVASSSNRHTRRRRWGFVRTPHIGSGRKFLAAKGRVTVVAPTCMLADAMTKVAMADRGLAEMLLARQGGRVMFEFDRVEAA